MELLAIFNFALRLADAGISFKQQRDAVKAENQRLGRNMTADEYFGWGMTKLREKLAAAQAEIDAARGV